MAKGLFDKAKKTATAKPKAKDEKIHLIVENPDFYDKIEKLEQLQDVMKASKAKSDMISEELKEIGKSEWAKLYEDKGRNPGSIILEQTKDDDIARLLFIPSDKYITITSERAEELQDIYGDGIVEEKTTFSFDNDMIELYGEIISRLIEECDEITEKDKEKIIKATTVYSVSKGVIDYLPKFGKVAEVMEDVKPVIALKNVEIIKG